MKIQISFEIERSNIIIPNIEDIPDDFDNSEDETILSGNKILTSFSLAFKIYNLELKL